MTAPNFTLITELQHLIRRDFPLANSNILNPFDPNALVDGEWLELDVNYKLARGTGEGILPSFPVFAERGRSDTQAILKTTILFLGQFEAETKIADLTGLAQGDPLSVQDVTIGGVTKRGLKKASATAGVAIVGYVSRLVAGSGVVRFIHTGTFRK